MKRTPQQLVFKHLDKLPFQDLLKFSSVEMQEYLVNRRMSYMWEVQAANDLKRAIELAKVINKNKNNKKGMTIHIAKWDKNERR